MNGKERLNVPCKLSSSFGELKSKISDLTGVPASHQKLIHKGKQPRDVDTLQAAGVKSGDKMMLMKSPSAAKDTAMEEKRLLSDKRKQEAAESQKLRDEHRAGALDAPMPTPASQQQATTVVEDERLPGEAALLISQGKVKYKVAIGEGSRSVEELKQRVAKLTGVDAKFHRLIYKGKELKDKASVEELGLKDGDKMLLLFAEGHHKAVDETALVEELKEDVTVLEGDVGKLMKKCEHGLFGDDQNEISIRLGVLCQEGERLLDNIRYLERTPEGRDLRSSAEEKLKSLMQTLESLRMKHVVGAHRK